MKKTIVVLLSVFFTVAVNAQTENKSGQVIYESVRKIEIRLQGDAAQFQNMLPKERKSKNELLFNADASLYQLAKKVDNDAAAQESSMNGGSVMMNIRTAEDIIFSDLKAKTNLEQREIFGRNFLVNTNTDTTQWKLNGNQKEILGYNCLEAELVGSVKKTIAWFAPMIPVSTGPDGYVGLPGLILSLDIDDGRSTYMAQSVNLKEIDLALLSKPKEGKKVTRKEFDKIREDKMKEMGGSSNGGAATFIISR